MSLAAGLRRAGIDDAPLALVNEDDGAVESGLGVDRDVQRLDVGPRLLLKFGGGEPRIDAGVGRPQPRHDFKARRVDRVGGDVPDGGQGVGLVTEIARIGEQADTDQHRGHRLKEARAAVHPQRHEGGESEQDGEQGQRERCPEGDQDRNELKEIRPLDADRKQRDREREHREPARPDGEPRGRLLDRAATGERQRHCG
jgi:hypothetical protein